MVKQTQAVRWLLPTNSPPNLQTVQAPFLGNPPLYVGFSWTYPLKSRIFQWTPKMLKFFIFNPVSYFKSN